MSSSALKFLANILARSKNETHRQAAQWILDAPAVLARQIGDIIFGGQAPDGTLSDEAVDQLNKLRNSVSADADPRPRDFLDDLVVDLNFVLSTVAQTGTHAIALRGFVHDKDSVSYWRVSTDQRMLSIDENPREIFVYPIAKLWVIPTMTDEALDELNAQISLDEQKAFATFEAANPLQVRKLDKSEVVFEETIRVPKRRGSVSRAREVRQPVDKTFVGVLTMLESIGTAQQSQQRDQTAYQAMRANRAAKDDPDK